MESAKNLELAVQENEQSEFDKDLWDGRNIGADIGAEGHYTLTFSRIYQSWLKLAAKKFIKYTFATKSWQTCRQRLTELNRFSFFLAELYPSCKAEEINRSIIIDYLGYVATKGWSSSTRRDNIYTLDIFLRLCSKNGWANVADKRMFEPEDAPRRQKSEPRYIPQEVLEQLNQHLDFLPESIMRMILVLQETGMRRSELCRLRFDCLRQDAAGDWWISYYQFKMKKDHSIAISKELAAVIQEQQKYINDNLGQDFSYLFCGRGRNMRHFIPGNKPMVPKQFVQYLKRLAKEKDIRDSSGRIWNFQAHQFRHTLGTRMINNGVPQHIVQRYLGHETPTMTATYAHIFDSTLKKEIASYYGRVVNIAGQVVESENPELETADLQWFKRNVQAQALPNGSCARPIIKGSCPHANACFTCGDFRTTLEFLDQHKEQLKQTEKIIEKAKANNWQRQVEMNEQVKTNLENIISSLELENAKTR